MHVKRIPGMILCGLGFFLVCSFVCLTFNRLFFHFEIFYELAFSPYLFVLVTELTMITIKLWLFSIAKCSRAFDGTLVLL